MISFNAGQRFCKLFKIFKCYPNQKLTFKTGRMRGDEDHTSNPRHVERSRLHENAPICLRC